MDRKIKDKTKLNINETKQNKNQEKLTGHIAKQKSIRRLEGEKSRMDCGWVVD